MKISEIFPVNTSLLYFKLHFFFSHGGYAGVLPFLPVIARQLGIIPTAFGIGFSLIPLFVFLSNPIIGFLVDYFQNIKVFLSILLLMLSASYFAILGIPQIKIYENSFYVRISPFNASDEYLNISEPLEKSCFKKLLDEKIQCELEVNSKFSKPDLNNSLLTDLRKLTYVVNGTNETENVFDIDHDRLWMTFRLDNNTIFDGDPEMSSIKQLHCSPNIDLCSMKDETTLVFSSYQFWAFIASTIVGAITCASIMNLSSVGCCEKLGSNLKAYGRQRVFGTISTGIVSTIVGILNDKEKAEGKPFMMGFYIMGVFFAIDIVVVCVMDIPKANMSSNMCKDLGKIFTSREIVTFSFGVLLIGTFHSIIAIFEYWFLEDIGANRTLIGLTVFTQCIIGEVPFIYFSGWFVDKLGHYLGLVLVLGGFCTRLIAYYLIANPWWALPIDALHGLTFGLYHGLMTSFAKVKAPKGMEATLMGTFGGLYDGLGYGIGSFVGGICFDYLGSRATFLAAGMISIGCILFFLVASYAFRDRHTETNPETSNSYKMKDTQ